MNKISGHVLYLFKWLCFFWQYQRVSPVRVFAPREAQWVGTLNGALIFEKDGVLYPLCRSQMEKA